MGPLTWIAILETGEIIHRKDPKSGIEISTEKIPRRGLKAIALVNLEGRVILTQHLEPGQRFIYRRRPEMDSNGNVLEVCHLIGWQKTVNGQNIQHISYVFENASRVEQAGEFKENHPWFYAINPVTSDSVEVTRI